MYYLSLKSGDFSIVFREFPAYLRAALEILGLCGGIFGLLFTAYLTHDSISIASAKYYLFIAFERNQKVFLDGNTEGGLFEILFPKSESLLVLKLKDKDDFDLFELSNLPEAPNTLSQAIEQAAEHHPEKLRLRALISVPK
jgi:hypothetical protein